MNYSLKSCVWEVTLACCFSCEYCGSGGGHAREHELDTKECLDVARQLGELGCRRVSLIGGEIFMRSDWRSIIAELVRQKIRVCVITNGFLLTEQEIQDLKDLQIESVAVSVDGTEQIHDKYRQTGSFARASALIDRLVRNEIPVSVITTLNRENADVLEDLYQELEKSGIFAWQLQACSPMGNARSRGVDYRFSPQKVLAFLKEHLWSAPFVLGTADNIGYYHELEGYCRGNLSGKGVFRGCRAGLTTVGIDSIGNVRGCESMYDERFIEGNLRERSLKEIWEDPNAFSYNRKFTPDQLTGACSTCDMGKYCAGGCRSYGYFVHGKMYEAPFCMREEVYGGRL